MPRLSGCATVSLAMTLIPTAFAQNVISARPGTINYVEGNVSLVRHTGDDPLNGRMDAALSLAAGESLKTTDGRAELQLTPSIFLRVGQNSRIEMISPSLIHTAIEVQRGRAEIEIDQLFEQNNLRVTMGSGSSIAQIQLVKAGLYEFDADAGVVRVFSGRAEVSTGSDVANTIAVKGGHVFAVSGDSAKPQSFNKKKASDDLIAWSDLRSQYVGQENAGLVQSAGGTYGNGFNSTGYDPGFGAYPWFPGGGFSSPYGFGLYSSFYGGPFGFGYPGFGYAGFGYPGFGYGLFGGSGYGLGGFGFGGYGYGGVPLNGLGRGGYTGQLGNRGQGRPGPGQRPVGTRGEMRSGATVGRSSAAGSFQGASGGFHGNSGGGGAAASHAGGGGSHR